MMLKTPITYQGGKQRLAKQIVDIIFEQNSITEETKFYDLCCGSGAITIELVNRGISPKNITMVDSGVIGYVWSKVAKGEFEIERLKQAIDRLPDIKEYHTYLKRLTSNGVNYDTLEYDYLLIQAGSFGGKQVWFEGDKWKNNTFRRYWTPTETSNRKSPVNPLMPMPQTLYDRMVDIVEELSSNIVALHSDVNDIQVESNAIVYIDPPYEGTTGYGFHFDYMAYINRLKDCKVYLSEGKPLSDNAILLSQGRSKGNINGKKTKTSVEEWLNVFEK